MGYYLSKSISSLADDTGTAAALRLRRLGAKTPIGSPFSHTILSAKYWDGDTKLAYYGFRFYSPGMGRWVSRDPVEEYDGPNLNVYVRNSSVNYIDLLGLTGNEISTYDYSVYLGISPALGNKVIERAAAYAQDRKSEYVAPAGANKKCRFIIQDRISSGDLRMASTQHDDIHFYGHGTKHQRLNPDWRSGDPLSERYIDRTALVFTDGDKYLSDVLNIDSDKVRAGYVITWVCYDKYVDTENPSGVKVCKPVNNPNPNLSMMIIGTVNTILSKCRSNKCCAPLD